ncbi:MAG TPA: OPT/YSL family transporter, partial [Phycisphaerae bacterium]|nr:OPT/YSL family transporter [Phycisphaerae bacterium]
MASQPQIQTKLPENAYRELKPGEKYIPMVPPNVPAPEITARSIIFGIIMNIIFSVVATYLALKAGQGIETAIPISILSIGLSGLLLRIGYRRSSLLENINILAISTTSGIVAGGTCFTMPAIYVLELNTKLGIPNWSLFLQIFFVPLLGAVLGVLMLIPFRRYFVKEMHGKFPFPEGTATNEILATGAAGGGNQAWVLIYSFVLAMAYNFVSGALKVFTETFTTGKATLESAAKSVSTLAFQSEFFTTMTNKIKAVFFMGTGAYYL